ncbi:MAG: LamB/YcsF family protein, partial [Bdellovibrionales bacterium]|nr:LamB/YcsF family protein [Bdellovibrionales bacterium]
MKDCRMLLNCDLGEFEGEITDSADLEIIPLIDMANVACGFHAG